MVFYCVALSNSGPRCVIRLTSPSIGVGAGIKATTQGTFREEGYRGSVRLTCEACCIVQEINFLWSINAPLSYFSKPVREALRRLHPSARRHGHPSPDRLP